MDRSDPTYSPERLSRTLTVASDPQRLKILCYLFAHKKSCVTEIADHIKSSVASASHHVHALAREELVTSNREGRQVCYQLADTEFVDNFRDFICTFTRQTNNTYHE